MDAGVHDQVVPRNHRLLDRLASNLKTEHPWLIMAVTESRHIVNEKALMRRAILDGARFIPASPPAMQIARRRGPGPAGRRIETGFRRGLRLRRRSR